MKIPSPGPVEASTADKSPDSWSTWLFNGTGTVLPLNVSGYEGGSPTPMACPTDSIVPRSADPQLDATTIKHAIGTASRRRSSSSNTVSAAVMSATETQPADARWKSSARWSAYGSSAAENHAQARRPVSFERRCDTQAEHASRAVDPSTSQRSGDDQGIGNRLPGLIRKSGSTIVPSITARGPARMKSGT